ncbi:hypothetical protein J6590_054830 [Homalodisca vitripennis]|nr:hypothetical protein J6590_054830 [Homalodisca vitripennis]
MQLKEFKKKKEGANSTLQYKKVDKGDTAKVCGRLFDAPLNHLRAEGKTRGEGMK